MPDVIGRLAGLQAQAPDPPYIALWSRRRLDPFGRLAPADRRSVADEAELLVRYAASDATDHDVSWARA